MRTILVIENAPDVGSMLRAALPAEKYALIEARTLDVAMEVILHRDLNLILLATDVTDGPVFHSCSQIRRWCDTPIIIVAEYMSEHEIVLALDDGADDYVVKPFGLEELVARIRALLRRPVQSRSMPTDFVTAEMTLDNESRQVRVRGRVVHLTPKEFQVLRYLIAHKGKAVPARMLFLVIWGSEGGDLPEKLRMVIGQLRKKIETDPSHPQYILTEHGVGYRFQPPSDASVESTPIRVSGQSS